MDQVVICKGCGKEFVFTEGEQKFYAERGFSAPVRCKPCRDVKKTQKDSSWK